MYGCRGLLATAIAAVLVVTLPTTAATAVRSADPQPGGRILYLEFDGSTPEFGALKSIRPSGLDGQDFGRQMFFASSPDYSPDGTRIAYTEGWSFRSMAADGSDDRWLGDGPYAPAFARWSPDGRWVVGEVDADIWAIRHDDPASGWTNLTGAHGNTDLIAAWAPNGRRFATATGSDIRIYSADGARVHEVIPLPGAYRLDWSPRGDLIAIEAQGDLWLVTPTSGAVRRLTNNPQVQDTSPVWSPDGHWLAFGQGPGTHDPELPGFTSDPVIWLTDSNGGQQHSIGVIGVPSSSRRTA